MEKLLQQAKNIQAQIVSWRRVFHTMPELRMDTPKTEAAIVQALKALGVEEIRAGIGGHGVRAVIRGCLPGKTLAIRADCDGLPIAEQTGLPFASQNGNMHACGHDAHTAMALGAVKLLLENSNQLRGDVVFLFQPFEEGDGGAKAMLAHGALEGVDGVIALHNHCTPQEEFQSGDILVHPSQTSANIYAYEATFHGPGGHVCLSRGIPNPVQMACRAADRICSLPAPGPETVNAVSVVQGGTRNNIIPESCTIAGSIRAFDPALQEKMKTQVMQILEDTARELGGSVCVEPTIDLMATQIHPALYHRFCAIAQRIFGQPCKMLTQREMIGEDFARFAHQVPGMFFMLHTRKDGQCYPLHHPKFDVDESVLYRGSAAFAAFALQWQED